MAISGTITHGIILTTAGTYASPLTITSTGAVLPASGYAIYGPNTQAWSVANFGTVSGSTGIFLGDGGAVANGASGATAALISGGVGIEVKGAVGAVTNAGTIIGGGGSGSGVYLSAGGTVANGLSGLTAALISGAAYGIRVKGAAGSVTNAGTIIGTGNFSLGIELYAGGTVANGVSGATAALISGVGYGLRVRVAAGTVTNAGTITAANVGGAPTGILMTKGGLVANGASGATAALIKAGSFGIYVKGAAGTVTNAGTIVCTGNGGVGIYLATGGTVTNGISGATAALISGGSDGIYVVGAAGTVTNAGTIIAGSGRGISLKHGGNIANGIGGATVALISGRDFGILVQGGVGIVSNYGTVIATGSGKLGVEFAGTYNDTLTNAGTIAGNGADAVLFAGGNDRLIVDPGAVFLGNVDGGAGANTLELAAAASAGTLTGLGTQFLNFTAVTVDPGATWTLSGSNTIAGTATLTDNGTLLDRGNLIVGASAALVGALSVAGGAAAEFQGPVANTATISFSTGSTLNIDDLATGGVQTQQFNAPLAGLFNDDKLRIATAGLGNFSGIDAATPGTFNGSTTPLVLTSAGNVVATLTLQGNYTGAAFGVSEAVGGFVTIGMQINAATDFNGDGTGDVLLRNDQNGQLVFAAMANGAFGGWGAATAPLGNLAAVGHGDVNGDGISDVIVQDPNSGQIYFGEENGSGSGSATWVLGPIVPGFTVVGIGDIQGNDRADIVIQDAAGNIDYYDTKAGRLYDGEHGGFVASTPGFNVVGVGDVTGDGYADIVIEDAAGHIDYINMAGGVASGFAAVATASGYAVKAVADLTGDGFADIVVQNPSSATDALYADMHGGAFSGWGVATTPLPTDYVVAGAADVFNNGHADLIVQQQSTGNTFYAQEGAAGFAGWGAVTTSINSHFHVV